MSYQNMSLEQFAKHVGMDVRDLHRLAERGQLPGHRVGGEWRFNQARVTEWLQQEMPSLDEKRLQAIERAMSNHVEDSGIPTVTSAIGLEAIDVALPARTKASVLRELVRLADRTGLLYDAEGLLAALEARESLCSTALPNGIAIPHPRQPMPYVSAEPLICVGRLTGGVAFGAIDRELTRLFFLICCHEDRHHLRVLARLIRMMDEATIQRALEIESAEEMLAMLIAREETVVRNMPVRTPRS